MNRPATPTCPPTRWGQWRFQRSGITHQRMAYRIPWDRLNTPGERAWWLIHLSHKNRTLYGQDVARDLEAALHAVLGRRPGIIDADRVASRYWDRIKPPRYRRRPPLPPLRKQRRAPIL